MRLGASLFKAENIKELDELTETLDRYGLSAIPAPGGLESMSDDDCSAFGERAAQLDAVIGEAGMWQNMMTTDEELQLQRIGIVRRMLQKADRMGCLSVVTTVGTADPSDNHLAPHADNYTSDFKSRFREAVLRILDGLDLKTTRYIIEPWHNNFFYQPEEIREFIESVDHPSLGLHLDQMNMVDQRSFFNTTDLIDRTFDLLAVWIVSVHLKDVRCDYPHMFLKWDEVYIGDGVMDYDTYLKELSDLPADTPCYCEHLAEERDYALNIARVKHFAKKAGVQFVLRNPR